MPEQPIIIKKKKGHGGHGHHGGSWKVAYADFVTAMMAFFMVMWIMGLSQETKSAIAGYFNDPLGFSQNEPRSRSIISMPSSPKVKKGDSNTPGGQDDNPMAVEEENMRQMQQELQRVLSNDPDLKELLNDVKIELTPEGLLIELMETRGAVFFESGSSIIRSEAERLVRKIAPVLAKSGRGLKVQGHTDAQPFAGDPIGNWRLSSARAVALQVILAKGGVQESQFKAVEGLASRKLLDPANPLNFSNRRVTILIPREYLNGDQTITPRDAIRQQMQQGHIPEAIDLRPGSPDLTSEGKSQ